MPGLEIVVPVYLDEGSARSTANDGSYRAGDESAAYYPRSTTYSGTPGSSVSRRR